MSKFRFEVFYQTAPVYESFPKPYPELIEELNGLLHMIYDFNNRFGDNVFLTKHFKFYITEVE